MDDGRPAVDAGLLGAVLERLPARLRRRLDADPGLAEAWTWTRDGEALAVSSADAAVTLRPDHGVLRADDAAICTCLLAPACLHIAAVLIRLEPVVGATDAADDAAARAVPGHDAADVAMEDGAGPSPEMLRAADELTTAVARLLDAGAATAGLVATGDLLRAVHSCQAVGLHRAAGAGLRVAQGLARLRDDDPSFRLRELRLDLVEGLTAARLVAAGRGDRAAVGAARRAYERVSAMRLYGLLTEPVIARGGYAGCVTYLVDEGGRVWALADLLPAEPHRAVEAYGQAAGLGDVSLTHRQLSRGGALIAEGRASANGRLGRGREVRAVSGRGARWSESPVQALFDQPLEAQLGRIWDSAALPETDRREGWSLVFLRATLAGIADGCLVLVSEGRRILATPAQEHQELLYRENLVVLGRASGALVLAIGRPVIEQPGRLELLAIGMPDDRQSRFPESWGDRANLGLDRIGGGDLDAGPLPSAMVPGVRSPDVADSVARRLDRMALGGRATLGIAARRGVDRDAARLRARHMSAGAELMSDLAAIATARSAPAALAEAWLGLAAYEAAVSRRLGAARWLEG